MIPTILQSEPSTPAFPIAGPMGQSASGHKTKKDIASDREYLGRFPDEACYDDAVRKANIVRDASAVSSEKALEVAQAFEHAKLELSRKGFATFTRELVGWAGTLGKRYIKLAQTFAGIDLDRLRGVEVGTLFKLSGRKYKAVVEYIKQSTEKITQQLVEDLIKELLPKKPRRQVKKVVPGNIALQEHVQGNDRYFTLHANGLNLERENALWLQEQLENRTFDQLLAFLRHQEAELQETEEAQAAVVVQELESENWVVQELRQHEEIEQARVADEPQALHDTLASQTKAKSKDSVSQSENLPETDSYTQQQRRAITDLEAAATVVRSLRSQIQDIEGKLKDPDLDKNAPVDLFMRKPSAQMRDTLNNRERQVTDQIIQMVGLADANGIYFDVELLLANGELVNLCPAPSRPRPADVLVQVFRDADNWEPIREALVTYANHKPEAWSALTEAEQQRVINLMPEAVRQLSKLDRKLDRIRRPGRQCTQLQRDQ